MEDQDAFFSEIPLWPLKNEREEEEEADKGERVVGVEAELQ